MKKYPIINTRAALVVGLVLLLLAVDSFIGNVGTQALVAMSFFPAFYRHPDPPEWDAATVFEKPEAAVAELEKRGYKIRTEEQETEFVTNATSTAVNDARKDERKLFLGTIDETVKTLTGVERDPTVKTTDYITAAVQTIIDKGKGFEADLAKLKENGMSDSDAAKEVKLQLDAVKLKLKTVTEEKESEILALKGDRWGDKVSTAKAESMAQILPKLVKVIANEKDMTQSVVNDVLADFDRKYKAIEHNGTIIYHNRADDTPVLDAKTGNHLSTQSLLENSFEHLVDKGRTQEGAGGAGAAGGAGGETKLNLPEGVITKLDLNTYLMGNDANKFTWEGKKLTGNEPIFHQLVAENTAADMPLR